MFCFSWYCVNCYCVDSGFIVATGAGLLIINIDKLYGPYYIQLFGKIVVKVRAKILNNFLIRDIN